MLPSSVVVDDQLVAAGIAHQKLNVPAYMTLWAIRACV
jgi:hypothetical protein